MEISFSELKSQKGVYNVVLDEDVIGRFTPLSPDFKFKHFVYTPKGKESMIYNHKEVFEFPTWKIDGIRHKCFINDKEVHLANKEFDLLYLFASRPNECITNAEITDLLWGEFPFTNTLDVHMKTLRHKIGDLIKTIRGVGRILNV